MKNKILKITIVISLILMLNLGNLMLLGKGLITYAQESIGTTNNPNVQFSAYFKNKEDNLKVGYNETIDLYLQFSVLNEGYFNGTLNINNSNFIIENFEENNYINKVEGNTITFNQLNVGTTGEIKITVKPSVSDRYDIDLLNVQTNLVLTGTYRDSNEEDIQINATRNLNLNIVNKSKLEQAENVLNEAKVITNKILKVEGIEKRVVQVEYNMGLKENSYPIKEINGKIILPDIEGNYPDVESISRRTNTSNYSASYDSENNNTFEFKLENKENEDGIVNWNLNGNESIIATFIYDADVVVENKTFALEQNVKLYNGTLLSVENKVQASEEIDNILEVETKFKEDVIYKGKIYSDIERDFETTTTVNVNYAKPLANISIGMDKNEYTLANEETSEIDTALRKTVLNKQEIIDIFGETFIIEIRQDIGMENIATINDSTETDEDGNIVIVYPENIGYAEFFISTSPIKEGNFNIINTESILNNNKEIEKNAKESKRKNFYNYNIFQGITSPNEGNYTSGEIKHIESATSLAESTTKITAETNKTELSTVNVNNVDMKVNLLSNNEKYDLYENPTITIQFPTVIKKISVKSLELLYENELVESYEVVNNSIVITLNGKQTAYKEQAVEGATLVMNLDLTTNETAGASDEQIVVKYTNENVNTYENKGNFGQEVIDIKIVPIYDATLVHNIKELGIETIGNEELVEKELGKGQEAKQYTVDFGITNNNDTSIESINILGSFPTNNSTNNLEATVNAINLSIKDGYEIYYTDNENALCDISHSESKWKKEFSNTAKKYLINIDSIEARQNVTGSYIVDVPANLKFDKVTQLGYQVGYTNSFNKTKKKLNATNIKLNTGIETKIKAELSAQIGGQDINGTVKNGEVIKYTLKITNEATQEAKNVNVKAIIPQGTTLVVPEENYEYSGDSYYKELSEREITNVIERLDAKESKYLDYEVRVNLDTEANSLIKNVSEITYKDEILKTNELSYTVEEGDLRVSVKRITDRDVPIKEGFSIGYYVIVENISGKEQRNIVLTPEYSEYLKISEVDKIQNSNEEEVTEITQRDAETDEAIYLENINIENIGAGNKLVYLFTMTVENLPKEQNNVDFKVKLNHNDKEYKSNIWTAEVEKSNAEISMTTTTDTYVKTEDVITYNITVKNTSNIALDELEIMDNIPEELTVSKVSIDGGEIEDTFDNEIGIEVNLKIGETKTIVIETIVHESYDRYEAVNISNVAYVVNMNSGIKLAESQQINHIIQADKGSTGNEGNQGNEGNEGNNTTSNNSLSGIAWFDANANGKKDKEESTIKDIKVRLVDVKTAQYVKDEKNNIIEATTSESGLYMFNKIKDGEYIIVFEHDNKYIPTKYKVEGISEIENSDAMAKDLNIEGKTINKTSTDIIKIEKKNVSNMNLGLIELKNFDLELNKYVSKVITQNSVGTTQMEYNLSEFAKLELDAKKLKNSNILIEYKIHITNNGEIGGFVKKVADYIPSDLGFSSELNKDWYQIDNKIYSESISNEKILPGETIELTLILTKEMTENNMGLINNMAEIAEDYNELGIKDSNSTPGNKDKTENDLGSADLIIGIKTGGITYMYIALGITALLTIVGSTIIYFKRKK